MQSEQTKDKEKKWSIPWKLPVLDLSKVTFVIVCSAERVSATKKLPL